ncbi:MAG: PD40 domain-containing protein, partial [Phycisphaerales bacterium]
AVPASGGKATRMPDAFSKNFAWSPDSKGFTVVSDGIISVAPVAGGKIQQIAKLKDLDLKSIFNLDWSPDGKHIACVGDHTEKGDAGPIFVIPAQGGKVTTLLTNDTTYKYGLHWSPDGKWISYNSEGPVKIRPEGTMWEADFEEILQKASR